MPIALTARSVREEFGPVVSVTWITPPVVEGSALIDFSIELGILTTTHFVRTLGTMQSASTGS